MAVDIRELHLQRHCTDNTGENHPASRSGPIYYQLYQRFRQAIAAGKLNPGDRVPSVRSLASELNLARGTIETAYQMLIAEGYLLTRGPAGTIVSPDLHPSDSARPAPSTITRQNTAAHHTGETHPSEATATSFMAQHAPAPRPFQLGLPALDAFPRKTWVRLAGRRLRTLGLTELDYPAPGGHPALREAITRYLGISRGIHCTAAQVFITAGYHSALDLICRTVLKPGDNGWFEEPGYYQARDFLRHAGMQLTPVPVDEDGLNIDAGRILASDARFAIVTPTHQSPLGVALTLPRRLALLEWASAQGAWVIEDDYDSEFRYQGRPLPALKSLDQTGCVLYTGTFSKVLYPGLRLAYLVVPPDTRHLFEHTAQQLNCTGATLLQTTVADFMEQGHFTRHLRKMRALYATRRGYLVDALSTTFGNSLSIPPRPGGIHTLAWLHHGNDRSLAHAAQAHGLAVQALNDWSIEQRTPAGLLLGFTNLATPDEAQKHVHTLHTLMQKC